MRVLAVILTVILCLEGLYCFLVFTEIPIIKRYRNAYIGTALSTMTHRWLAEALLPEYMVRNVALQQYYTNKENEDKISNNRPTVPPDDNSASDNSATAEATEPSESPAVSDEDSFYELFWELSRTSFEDYLDEHPDTLKNGWNNIYINEAGINDDGTSIYTTMGEQVLAIDAANKVLLVRVQGTGYIGVLAVCKDPSQLRCHASQGLAKAAYGQSLEDLVEDAGAVIGITGSGFIDPSGNGNGGTIAGWAMCEGDNFGSHYTDTAYKRIELTRDNKMYITNAYSDVASDVTDAVEFAPALVVDGVSNVTNGAYDSYGIQPRAAVGQSATGEILMLIIEGRQITRSIGASIEDCGNILMRHNAYTALNLDGGTSAVMWYRGEYVTKCSNTAISSRLLPNAWVYGNYSN